MQTIQKITSDVYYIGACDMHHHLFENIYPVPEGMTYNAYLIADDKTVLTDTCDVSVRDRFLENLKAALNGRPLDYVFVHHMEPDHCAVLDDVLTLFPAARIVCNAKTQILIGQFFNRDVSDRVLIVKEGDTLATGRHAFTFYMAPMVHWPEVMVSYDAADKILFSADAFGSFGTMNECLFADERDIDRDWLPEARRYYTNIVGKYGPSVQALLKKATGLDIQMICPLHGPIWRRDLARLLDKYQKWSTYTPEEKGVVIVYGSIYGHTENAACALAQKLSDRGVYPVHLYDASLTHPSYIVAEAFCYSHLVFASVTYNNGIFPPVETVLLDLKAHNLQNRSVALIQNGSWAPASGKLMAALLSDMKGITLRNSVITIASALKPEQESDLNALADELAADWVS